MSLYQSRDKNEVGSFVLKSSNMEISLKSPMHNMKFISFAEM